MRSAIHSNSYLGVKRINCGYYYAIEHHVSDMLLNAKYKTDSGIPNGYDRVTNEKAKAILNALIEERDLTKAEEVL